MSYKKNKNSSSKKAKYLTIVVFSLVAILFALFILEATGTINYFSKDEKSSIVEENEADGINFDPPTSLEQNSGNNQKEEIVEKEKNDQDGTVENRSIDVIIVDSTQYNSQIEVRAFAANIIEDGICTITFSLGNEAFAKQVPAKADASTTPCLTLNVPRTEFGSAGKWTVEIEYKSTGATGKANGSVDIN